MCFSDANKKISYKDTINVYGYSMSQPLPFDEIKFEGNVCLGEKLDTHDDSDIGYFTEVDSKYRNVIKEKTKKFRFSPKRIIFTRKT